MGERGGDGEPVLGKQGGGADEGRRLPCRAGRTEGRGEAALPDRPAIKGRGTPANLAARFPAPNKCTSHLGFDLGCARPFPLAWVRAFSTPGLWYNAWTTAEGLRVRAVVVGATDGGARRRWTEAILFGGGSVSPYSHDRDDDDDPEGTASARVLACRPPPTA